MIEKKRRKSLSSSTLQRPQPALYAKTSKTMSINLLIAVRKLIVFTVNGNEMGISMEIRTINLSHVSFSTPSSISSQDRSDHKFRYFDMNLAMLAIVLQPAIGASSINMLLQRHANHSIKFSASKFPKFQTMKYFLPVFVLFVAAKVGAIGPLGGFGVGVGAPKCEPTLTTASGSHVIHKPNGQFCSGDLIFEDTFDLFDVRKWQHENTLSGNGVCYRLPSFTDLSYSHRKFSYSTGSFSGTRTTDRTLSATRAT